MTPLDQHIRQMMLSYPDLYANRNQALRDLFCHNGNGLGWKDGRIVDLYSDKAFDEGVARAAFFRTNGIDPESCEGKLLRTRREFELETLDLRVKVPSREDRPDVMALLRNYYRMGWLGMNVPEDAEESYRLGALEALRDVAATLRGAQLLGHPTIIEICQQIDALDPKDAEMTSLLLEMLDCEDGEEPVPLGAIERGATAYCIPFENDEDFAVLCRADDAFRDPLEPSLLDRLEGHPRKAPREIEGVSRVEYNGHFGAAVHYTVDAEDDLPDTHDKIRRIIADQVRRARAWAAAKDEKETS